MHVTLNTINDVNSVGFISFKEGQNHGFDLRVQFYNKNSFIHHILEPILKVGRDFGPPLVIP